MSAVPDAATAARDLLDAVEREARDMTALRDLHDAIGSVSGHSSDTVVALLSLLPFVNRDAVALGFFADAMEGSRLTMRALLAAQRAATELLDSGQARADSLAESFHSIRVPS